MPGGDRTGPAGVGPMTGRRAGYCAGFSTPGYANQVYGWGWGIGRRGGGRGHRNWFYATGLPRWQRHFGWYPAPYGNEPFASGYQYPSQEPGMTKEAEIDALKEQAAYLEDTLRDVRKRMEALEKKESSE